MESQPQNPEFRNNPEILSPMCADFSEHLLLAYTKYGGR